MNSNTEIEAQNAQICLDAKGGNVSSFMLMFNKAIFFLQRKQTLNINWHTNFPAFCNNETEKNIKE